MNWDAVGAVGEIIGAVAVFASLLYLAKQIRISNIAERQAAQRELQESTRHLMAQMTVDEQLAEIYLRGSANDDTLTNSEKVRYRGFLFQLVMLWERTYWLNEAGQIDDWLWQNNTRNRAAIMVSPGFRAYFTDRKETFSPEFVKFIEKQLATLNADYHPLGIRIADDA